MRCEREARDEELGGPDSILCRECCKLRYDNMLSLVYTCAQSGLDSIRIPIHLIDMGWATRIEIWVGTVHTRSESGSNPG